MMYNDKTVKERIEEIMECQKAGYVMRFFPPATDEEISDFEKKNDILIPESYKEWLRFSNGGYLFGFGGPHLYGTLTASQTPIGDDFSNAMVPKEYGIVGYWGSEHICYHKTTGKFFFYEYEEPSQYFDDFSGILAYIIDIRTNI